MDTIGFMELSSIAKGIEIVDAMLKSAQIELIYAKASCPGKYYILINGFISNVQKSIDEGKEIGKGFVISSLVLSKIHKNVISAIMQSSMPEKISAIGVMEFYSVTSSIVAGDIAVKSSRVEIMDLRLGTGIGGKSFLVITGDTSSVTQAVEAATKNEDGMLINKVVISNPKKELIESLY